MKRVHIFIEGRVQGVGFRHYTKKNARANNLGGWVRNLSDGRVEAVFEGEEEELKNMIKACRQGPPSARVRDIDVRWEAYRGEFDHFSVSFF